MQSKPTVAVCMIVKNEAQVIERCLESLLPVIDSYSIVDTGSTDATADLITKMMENAGKGGSIHHRPWVDFGHNRSEALQLAKGTADWLLLIDADATWEGDLDLPPDTYPEPPPFDGFNIEHRFDTPDTVVWQRAAVIRGDLDWNYVGAVHEYLNITDRRIGTMEGCAIVDHYDGGNRGDKGARELAILTREVGERPDDPRPLFYLAGTHRDLGNIDYAISLFERRAAMPDTWEEERWYAQYQAARWKPWPEGLAALLAAHNARPSRIEPLADICLRLRADGLWAAAEVFADAVERTPPSEDVLFTAEWMRQTVLVPRQQEGPVA